MLRECSTARWLLPPQCLVEHREPARRTTPREIGLPGRLARPRCPSATERTGPGTCRMGLRMGHEPCTVWEAKTSALAPTQASCPNRRPSPRDVVYVRDCEHPAAPRRLVLPAGAGPALVHAMEGLIHRLKEHIPTVVEGDEFKHAQAQLAVELETKNRAVIHELESVAKTLGFGVRPVHCGVQTFPVLHGKAVSAEQYKVLHNSTNRALTESEH